MSKRLRICIAGLTGKVGTLLARTVLHAPDLELVGGTSRKHYGQTVAAQVPDCSSDVILAADVPSALVVTTDVLIDYTHPEIVEQNVVDAIKRNVHVVIGTSGLTDSQYESIDALAKKRQIGVIAAGNFSLAGALMQHFALIAAKHIPTWEIVDFGTEQKPDAPSGTARELAFRLSQVRKPHYEIPDEQIRGDKTARGAQLNGSKIHSFRLPGYFSRSEVLFGAPEQRLTVRYEAIGSQPYVDGTLLAARKVSQFVGLRRGLDSIMDF
jgi:4-hydroxy-tetrahydrodipicolinate reductase